MVDRKFGEGDVQRVSSLLVVALSTLAFAGPALASESVGGGVAVEINRATNNDALADLASEFQRKFVDDEAAVQRFLAANPGVLREYEKNGLRYRMIRIDRDGQPVYQVNRGGIGRNVASGQLIKADALYPGGSLGVNITGTGMTVGVWEPSLPRATHELLRGKVTIESGQTAASDDDHATHVTGTIVGNALSAGEGVSARGVAYGALSRNWDADNDQSEMATAAASGLLISNHSYGLANDDTTPEWQFGAYDDEAAAWDRITRLAPYYLPFVAGGNEQQSNGNMGKNGYDLITGATGAKNVMTVGALNGDKSMSDYSNWGPTDDGRIKPEIVAKGTGINSAQGSSDTAYSGNGSDSSGTSYASPISAGAGLLLQQYYHSLNNSYMRASTLKTLMMGTAEDLGRTGPDHQFGYGLLDIEAAARAIQKNSVASATAGSTNVQVTSSSSRGALIYEWALNPVNDGTSELLLDVYAKGGGRPLLINIGWTDDEGVAQTSSNGVDPTTNRDVYNFDIQVTDMTTSSTYRPWVVPVMSQRTNNAVPATNWFQANGGPFRQVVISAPNAGTQYRVAIRKSAASPAGVRTLSVVATGLLEAVANSQTKADCLFEWAERVYADYLKPAGQASISWGDYYYRHYSGTQAYLGTSNADNQLYYMGPLTANELKSLGGMTDWLSQSGCQ